MDVCANLKTPYPYFRVMKHYFYAICLFLASCGDQSSTELSLKEGKSFKPKYAQGFEIIEFDNKKQIILFDLENPGDTLEVIEISQASQNIACLSTTHLSFFDKLKNLHAVKAVAFADLVRNSNARAAIDNKKIQNLSSADDVDLEVLISLKPDWFFVYPYGHGSYEKYTSKGIRCFPVSEYLEKHPLGRVEWIKVFGAVVGQDSLASSVFADIENKYLKIKDENTKANGQRPCVFTGSEEGGMWYAPPGNSFQSILINDAGANYILNDSVSNRNIALPFESMVDLVFDCDFWGRVEYSTEALSYDAIAQEDSRFTKIKAFQNKQVFYCNTNEKDYFGDAIIEPHHILNDLTHIFHPSNDGYEFRYFEPVK